MKGGEVVKYEEKGLKRENSRGINQRCFRVSDVSQALDEQNCQTILIPDPDVSFEDMYHYYTCK